MSKTILVADDDKGILRLLEIFLKEKGLRPVCVPDGASAIKRAVEADIAVLDINMPEMDGLDVLNEIKKTRPSMPVIIMTADSTMKNTIEAMKCGAFDYVTKPIDIDEFEVILDKAVEDMRLRGEVAELRERLYEATEAGALRFIGKSKKALDTFKAIGRIASKDVTVLLRGESGTGKELVARLIHSNSQRRDNPFIALNSAAVPKELLESELFGHEKGAFTGATEAKKGKFELANTGTLLLDEIGDMEMGLQAKLLRALQDKEFYRVGGKAPIKVDIRIISATNQDLEAMVEKKRFREDLFYRLNVVGLTLPPLRERRGDIELLTEHFLAAIAKETGAARKSLSAAAKAAMEEYQWPGNIRELENTLRRAAFLSGAEVLTPTDLALPGKKAKKDSIEELIEARLEPFVTKSSSAGDLYDAVMPFLERPLIKLVLKKTRFNQVKAAEMLGINRNTLRKKIHDLKITKKDMKQG
ncbi:MAG: sigma-54 dependent transcriptional regulator [Deltaproteobacteria bacterium]|nr:sigma-54 dependent transcriptional regulator [Deltaproteobacteria bacterium]